MSPHHLLPAALSFGLIGSFAHADWPIDPGPEGLLVFHNSYYYRQTVPDGIGGAYVGIEWFQSPHSAGGLYLQRVDGQGALPWGANGVEIGYLGGMGLLPSEWYIPHLAADGSGGVFALFFNRNLNGQTYDLAVTHRGPNGASLWPSQAVTVAPGSQTSASWIGNDGAGGCIAVWFTSDASGYHYYAQRLDGTGTALWGSGGVALGFETLWVPAFVGDGAGGLIAFWSQAGPVDNDIYAQRYGPDGMALSAGIAVCTAPGDQGTSPYIPSIVAVSDGFGGACVAWVDRRDDASGDLYAQRIDATGSSLWAPDGVAVCAVAGAQEIGFWPPTQVAAVSDDTGGACFVWQDQRAGAAGIDLYGQRIDGTGTIRWNPGGLAISTGAGDQTAPSAAPAGASGVLVAWHDNRDPPADIYVQHIDGTGVARGNPSGNLVGASTTDQRYPQVVADGAGGATSVWGDFGFDVRARNVPAAALQVGVEEPHAAFELRGSVPNPTTGAAAISFSLAVGGPVRLEVLDVAGRRAWKREERLGPGAHVVQVGKLPAGLYLVRLSQNEQTAAIKVVFLP